MPFASVVTVIVASPSLNALTKPLSLTEATVGALEANMTFLFVALDGKTVTPICFSSPLSKVISSTSISKPVVAVSLTVTLTVLVSGLPSAAGATVLTVITALPTPLAVIKPSSSTVATSSLFEQYKNQ